MARRTPSIHKVPQLTGALKAYRAAKVFSAALLSSEPRIANLAQAKALSERFLTPALADIEALLLHVRATLDPVLAARQPVKNGKPYPLGQCLEISQAVGQRLKVLRLSDLPERFSVGFEALQAYKRHGGAIRRVWGDLRGQYFQNAFLVGNYYMDVSNDTVVPTKPKVEILPLAQANFHRIEDYEHFSRVAQRYWKVRLFPNHILPALAPLCPLVSINPEGRMRLHELTDYMLKLTSADGFRPSERALRVNTMPADVFDRLSLALKGSDHALACSPEQGRLLALRHCLNYRHKRWHLLPDRASKVIKSVQDVNLRLVKSHQLVNQPWQPAAMDITTSSEQPKMPTIRIDNRNYNLDTLSVDARAQLASLQFVDTELARLQAQAAVLQTARVAYSKALQAALPVLLVGDTMKFN